MVFLKKNVRPVSLANEDSTMSNPIGIKSLCQRILKNTCITDCGRSSMSGLTIFHCFLCDHGERRHSDLCCFSFSWTRHLCSLLTNCPAGAGAEGTCFGGGVFASLRYKMIAIRTE